MKKVSEKQYSLSSPDSGYDKKLFLRKYRLPNGALESFWIDNAKNSVQVFAITKEREVVCVSQFRPGSEKVELELPGGGMEEGEDPKKAAARELLEETGHSGEDMQALGYNNYSPYSTGKRFMFLVTNCAKIADLDLDPNEFLTVKLVPLEEFRAIMKKGQVRGTDLAYMALDVLDLL